MARICPGTCCQRGRPGPTGRVGPETHDPTRRGAPEPDCAVARRRHFGAGRCRRSRAAADEPSELWRDRFEKEGPSGLLRERRPRARTVRGRSLNPKGSANGDFCLPPGPQGSDSASEPSSHKWANRASMSRGRPVYAIGPTNGPLIRNVTADGCEAPDLQTRDVLATGLR